MNKKALVFDLDGTLWNACKTIAVAWTKTKNEFQIDREDISQQEVESICGLTTEDVFKRIFPNDFSNTELVHQCLNAHNQLLKEQGGDLYPDVVEVLAQLKHNYDLYIVSNCSTGYIETFITAHQLADYFKDWACYGDECQPKAYNLKQLIQRNAIEDAVYIGDTVGDEQAAIANEVPFCFCAYGFGQSENYQWQISSFKALLDIFK